MPFYQAGRKAGDFDHGVEMVLARILADPRFIYRVETEPPTAKANQPYRISDLDLASRLSFFFWSRSSTRRRIDWRSGSSKSAVERKARRRSATAQVQPLPAKLATRASSAGP